MSFLGHCPFSVFPDAPFKQLGPVPQNGSDSDPTLTPSGSDATGPTCLVRLSSKGVGGERLETWFVAPLTRQTSELVV